MPACLFLALVPSLLLAADPPERPSPEENILQKAGVAMDGDGLLTFFRAELRQPRRPWSNRRTPFDGEPR